MRHTRNQDSQLPRDIPSQECRVFLSTTPNPLTSPHDELLPPQHRFCYRFGFGARRPENQLLHSCVFTRRLCTSWSFYESLMTELDYTPTP